jgi:cation:H+ antiporter
MIAVAVACLPFFFTGQMISRWEGFVFLGYYAAYLIYLILNSTHHKGLPVFSAVMMGFVIPITILTMLVLTWRAMRGEARTRKGNSNR